jgi:protein-S-isoprenylcysteine O-methyltransferase Ste14
MKSSFIERGGAWVVVQGAIMTAILVLSMAFRVSPFHPTLLVAGAIFLLTGAGFAIAGTWSLGSNLTPFPKPMSNAQLVRHGIYSRVRHPLYTGVTSLAAGWSLAWQSPSALAASLVLGLFFDIKARGEERWLREKFPDYAAYSGQTKKFIPWIY